MKLKNFLKEYETEISIAGTLLFALLVTGILGIIDLIRRSL